MPKTGIEWLDAIAPIEDGMDCKVARLVSDDQLLVAQFQHLLDEAVGCELVVQSLAMASGPHRPLETASWVFIDLRTPALWEQLPALIDSWRKRGVRAPVIGIVDDGFPSEQVVVADHCLSSALNWPAEKESLTPILKRLSNHQIGTEGSGVCRARVLRGATRKFLTYTPALFSILDELEVAAQHNFTILLVGETGTGKTTLARLIHELSPRRDERLLTVACGALPEELINSELFGYVRGAFTGADRTKEGKFDAANRGTLLLDEIDILSMMQQANLLRVIDSGEFEPVGSNDTHEVDTRIIVASNNCLETLIDQQRFRPDLYFRLNQMKFEIPPLRRRPQDIIPLTLDIVEECCQEHGLHVRRIHPDLTDVLKAYSWPGNIRELRNEVRRAVLFSQNGVVTPAPLSPRLLQQVDSADRGSGSVGSRSGLAGEVAQTEQEAIEQMLRVQKFNRAATARALGISRVTLYNKIRKYRISVESLSSAGKQT